MQNRTTKELFDLVKGMNKWEKKNFNRYARRYTNSEGGRVQALFRVLNAMDHYQEKVFLQKVRSVGGLNCPA